MKEIKKNKYKRACCILVAATLACSLVPVSALAEVGTRAQVNDVSIAEISNEVTMQDTLENDATEEIASVEDGVFVEKVALQESANSAGGQTSGDQAAGDQVTEAQIASSAPDTYTEASSDLSNARPLESTTTNVVAQALLGDEETGVRAYIMQEVASDNPYNVKCTYLHFSPANEQTQIGIITREADDAYDQMLFYKNTQYARYRSAITKITSSGNISLQGDMGLYTNSTNFSDQLKHRGLFSNLIALTDISALSSWDVSAATNLDYMFSNCTELVDISTLANWKIDSATSLEGFFSSCESLSDISALENFDISGVRNLSHMFAGCEEITSIAALTNWDTSSATTLDSTFLGCKSLKSLEGLENWDVKQVESLGAGYSDDYYNPFYGTFSSCEKITSIEPLKNWELPKLKSIGSVFAGCKSLSNIDLLESWDVSKVTNMSGAFKGCEAIYDITPITAWNVSAVTDFSYMFSGAVTLSYFEPLRNWNMSNAKNLEEMFSNCDGLISLSFLSNWDISCVENMSGLFSWCINLKNLSGLFKWNTASLTNLEFFLDGCTSLPNLNGLQNFKTQKVESFYYAFAECEALSDATAIASWSSAAAQELDSLFSWSTALARVDLSFLNDCPEDIEYPSSYVADCSSAEMRSFTLPNSLSKFMDPEQWYYSNAFDISDIMYTYPDGSFYYLLEDGTRINSFADLLAGWDTYKLAGQTVEIIEASYMVKFNANATDAAGKTADQTMYFGNDTTLNLNGFTRAGYIFSGWATLPNSADVSYSDGAEVKNLAEEADEVVNLYAVWEACSEVASITNGQAYIKDISGNKLLFTFSYDVGGILAPLNGVIVKMGGTSGAVSLVFPDIANNRRLVVSVSENGVAKAAFELSAQENDGTSLGTQKTDTQGKATFSTTYYDEAWTRLYGSNRYLTNASIVRDGFFASDTDVVVLATGDNFPDALAASGFAGIYNAPLVLTPKNDSLGSSAKDEIARLKPSTVYVLGDENTISEEAENEVLALCSNVVRIAGSNRIETAEKIYDRGVEAGKWGDTAIVTWADGFADALSVAPISYKGKYPIFLSESNGDISDDITCKITHGNFKRVILLGGTNRVSEKSQNELVTQGLEVVRLAGGTRHETSIDIAEWGVKNVEGLNYDHLLVARSDDFADGLSGGALAGKRGSVLLIADDSEGGLAGATKIVGVNATKISWGTFIGDENSINAHVAEVFEAASKDDK